MANRTKLTNRARKRFIEVVKETGNVSEAARQIKMSRSYMYEVREREEESDFRDAWDEAVAIATDALEGEARRRAVGGWDEPVYYKGDTVGHIRKYSDRMLELLLKGHLPEKYRDNVKTEHTGSVTIKVVYDN